ncbi:MAG: Maf family nucleotide pyrophosphatase [Pseudomonadota bacterium]|nr:Maf family nucleotide pyrophosphatase [Pseudomonadota bacterium]
MTQTTTIKLILASSSPRRLHLLAQIGITPDSIVYPDIDESVTQNEKPREYVKRMASAKADVAKKSGEYLLAADTAVVCGNRILPKAETKDAAGDCLSLLSGRRHKVLGGICLLLPNGERRMRLVETTVSFKRLTESEIDSYLNSSEWDGKAGGYAIQGRAASFVKHISGSYSNVVGLPLYNVSQLLRGNGYLW